MKKLAIITTHPIQYNAPFFKELASSKIVQPKVFYTWGEDAQSEVFDPAFGITRKWDIPLLEGYTYEFVRNTASDKGSHHFWGIRNPDLNQKIKAFQPDAILVYGWNFYSHLNLMLHFHGRIPIWFRGDSTNLRDSEKASLKKWIRKKFLKRIYKLVDLAFYVGQNNKVYFLSKGIKEHQLIFAPHAIDILFFDDPTKEYEFEAHKRRMQKGVPDNALAFLYAGKLEPIKNLLNLVTAFKAIQSQQIYLLIAGDGALKNEIETEIVGIKNILLLPFHNQKEMPILYRMADVFVLPSHSETWGLSINEAMACKRAVIVSDKCGCAVNLVATRNGWTTGTSVNSLGATLKQAIEQRGKIPSFGEASYELIQGYNFKQFVNAIELVFK